MANHPYAAATELLGVTEKPRHAGDRLVLAAINLFYRHGFNAVGIDRVIEDAGVTKTTFYKHFASKDDLMVEAIRRRDEWELKAWAASVQRVAGDDPKAQLVALFDVLDEWFNDPRFGGCMFLNAAAEFPNPHDPVHEAAATHKRRVREGTREQASAAGVKDVDTFADRYAVLLEGTLVLRQVLGRNDAAKLVKPMIEALLKDFTERK